MTSIPTARTAARTAARAAARSARNRPRTASKVAALIAIATLAAACGSSSPASRGSSGSAGGTGTTGTTATSSQHGTAAVACAGSLLKLYENTLGPAFKQATGDNFGGPPCAGSLALASEILSNEISPGVFLSIGAKAIKKLFPTGRAKFAMAVAADPLVIGYSPKSRYFAQLNDIKTGKKPLSDLFTLFTTSGFRLGRTDPTQDPQGIFFILMSKLAQSVLHLPAGQAAQALGITATSPFGSKSQILDEAALPTDIASGVVDAGSEYLPQARQFGLDYITLPPTLNFATPAEKSLYSTVSLNLPTGSQAGEVIYLNIGLVSPKRGGSFAAADEAADQAFVTFMLSNGRSVLQSAGYELTAPVLHLAPGVKSAAGALPPSSLSLFNSLGGSIASS